MCGLALRVIKAVLSAELVNIDGHKSRNPPRNVVVLEAGEWRRGPVIAHTGAAVICRILRHKIAWLAWADSIVILAIGTAEVTP
jgi:hypothetical protein